VIWVIEAARVAVKRSWLVGVVGIGDLFAPVGVGRVECWRRRFGRSSGGAWWMMIW